LLRHILGFMLGAGQTPGQAVDPALMTLDQDLERAQVAVLGGADQIRSSGLSFAFF